MQESVAVPASWKILLRVFLFLILILGTAAMLHSQPSDSSLAPSLSQVDLIEDLVDVIFAVLLIAIGTALLALWAFFLKAHDRSPVCFAIFCILYGMRLIFDTDLIEVLTGISHAVLWDYVGAIMTYILPIPALAFIEQMFGRGWKSSISFVLYVQILYAAVAIPVDLLEGPESAMGANGILVLCGTVVASGNIIHFLLKSRPQIKGPARVLLIAAVIFVLLVINENLKSMHVVPWALGLEPLGLLIFVLALGYFVAHRLFSNQKRLMLLDTELQMARQIQYSILPQELPSIAGLELAVRYNPMTEVGGDFYDFVQVDADHLAILVADVSGHGVPAALIASMLKTALASLSIYATDPARVLTAMNEIFHGKLQRSYITAVYALLDLPVMRLSCANAGHPPVLVWRRSEAQILPLAGHGLPIGPFPKTQYNSVELKLKPGDRILLYTDGVVEAMNKTGELFGNERFRSFIASSDHFAPDVFAQALENHIESWAGRRAGEPLDDDFTLLVVDTSGL